MAAIIKVYRKGIKIAGAFTKDKALEHAKRIAGSCHPGHGLKRRGDQLGYDGSGGWIYIISPKEDPNG